MKFSYYPGCILHATAREFDTSLRSVCDRLGIELLELDDWNCCGGIELASYKLLSLLLSARNIRLAEGLGLSLMTPCSICFHNLARAEFAIREDPMIRKNVEDILGSSYVGIRLRHPLDVIVNDLGLDKLRSMVKKPLVGIKVASYYGCLLLRPSEICRFDDPSRPESLDGLVKAVGAETVPFLHKTKCCGGRLLMGKEDFAYLLTKDILLDAKQSGADCVIAACPLCHHMLDSRQSKIEKAYAVEIDVPVLYFTQFVGIALGIQGSRLGLQKNIVSPYRMMSKIGEVR